MVDPVMMKIVYIQGIIYSEHIRLDDIVRLDSFLNDGHEPFCPRIGYYGCLNLPVALEYPETAIFPAAPGPRLPFPSPPS